jgi:hypothetical protein
MNNMNNLNKPHLTLNIPTAKINKNYILQTGGTSVTGYVPAGLGPKIVLEPMPDLTVAKDTVEEAPSLLATALSVFTRKPEPPTIKLHGCSSHLSNTCSQLNETKMRKSLVYASNTFLNYINNFVSYIGTLERQTADYSSHDRYFAAMIAILNAIELTKPDSFFQRVKKINDALKINVNVENKGGKFFIEKKKKIGSTVIKTKHELFECSLFGAGNLSPTIILKLNYANFNEDKNEVSIINVVAKTYPITAHLINHHSKHITDPELQTRFTDMMKFMYYREALIGCWVRDNLLINTGTSKKKTATFMCVNDTYIVKGLPLSKKKLAFENKNMKNHKYWLTDYLNAPAGKYPKNMLTESLFGVIEMEKVDMTLQDFLNKGSLFGFGMLFEIMYSKLVLSFYGNVYMLDDHFENIMVKATDRIRKYIITYRNSKYVFFVDNNCIIKYIDLERFEKVSDREEYMDVASDVFLSSTYGLSYKYEKDTASVATDFFDHVRKYPNVSMFCELMYKFMPDRMTNPDLYIGKEEFIDEYEIDLDIPDDKLEENFLSSKLPTDKSRAMTFKIWNNDDPDLLLKGIVQTGSGFKSMKRQY